MRGSALAALGLNWDTGPIQAKNSSLSSRERTHISSEARGGTRAQAGDLRPEGSWSCRGSDGGSEGSVQDSSCRRGPPGQPETFRRD